MRATVFYSSAEGARWDAPISAEKSTPCAVVTLDPQRSFQRVLGFGGAFTEASAYVFSQLSPSAQREFLTAYFDPEEGLGYTLGRVGVHSNDFSLCSYVYAEENDWSLKSFSLEHEQLWLLPLLRQAKERCGSLKLMASAWSPPSWMKTNKSMLHGGSLCPEHRAHWAEYLHRYLSEMKRHGVPIDYLSIQNEPEAVQPWESCLYTPEQEAAFIAEHLGPLLRKHHPDVHLLGWDHNRDHIKTWTDALMKSPAAEYIWGIGYHWYVSDDHGALTETHCEHPRIHLVFTEGCLEGGPAPDSWEPAARYAENYLLDFNNWCEGFLDWNLLLDSEGGPNHVGNYCHAPVLADTSTRRIFKSSAYYAIGHFSRVLRPGAVRIGVQCVDDLWAAAGRNQDGSLACIVYNPTAQPQNVQIQLFDAGPVQSFFMEPQSLASMLISPTE